MEIGHRQVRNTAPCPRVVNEFKTMACSMGVRPHAVALLVSHLFRYGLGLRITDPEGRAGHGSSAYRSYLLQRSRAAGVLKRGQAYEAAQKGHHGVRRLWPKVIGSSLHGSSLHVYSHQCGFFFCRTKKMRPCVHLLAVKNVFFFS